MTSQLSNQNIEVLEAKSNEELLNIIGVFALSQNPDTLKSSLAFDNAINKDAIQNAAKKFIASLEPLFREVICGSGGIADLMEEPTVQDVLTILLPLLGYTTGDTVPMAITALSFILVRAGIRNYCRNGLFTTA